MRGRIRHWAREHWNRLSPIDADGRHIVIVKELVLIVADHHDYVGVHFRERLAQPVQRRLNRISAFFESLNGGDAGDGRISLSEHLLETQVPTMWRFHQLTVSRIVLFRELIPEGACQGHKRAMRRCKSGNDLGHWSLL